MHIGYACQTVGVPWTKLRTCTIKNASPDFLLKLIESNLEALDNILDYNIKNGIKLFRISSDIIPFGSHVVNTLKWWEIFNDKLNEIGRKAITNSIRLSMHPGQYTVLNSPSCEIVERAADDLRYHTRFLNQMGLGMEHKIVLHVGGVYGSKKDAIFRFIKNYRALDETIKCRLVIENDDRHYNISDVLCISKNEGIPVVFDNLHHEVNPDNTFSESEWITCCKETWKIEDGRQKLHYSQQDLTKKPGSHSSTLNAFKFLNFYNNLPNHDTDIMMEVKDKNLSAIKCINLVSTPNIELLEIEWERYKLLVLERSKTAYNEVQLLLKDKVKYPVLEFYSLIDQALLSPLKIENVLNAADEVWGHLKDSADSKTKLRFEKHINKVSMGKGNGSLKHFLWKLAVLKEQKYLLNSLYFMNIF